MDANEAQKHAHQMVGALRVFHEAEQVLKAAAQAEGRLKNMQNQIDQADADLTETKKKLTSARGRLKTVEADIEVKEAEAVERNRKREAELQKKMAGVAGEAQSKAKELVYNAKLEKEKLDKDIKKRQRELRKLENQITTYRGQLAGLQQTLQQQASALSA